MHGASCPRSPWFPQPWSSPWSRRPTLSSRAKATCGMGRSGVRGTASTCWTELSAARVERVGGDGRKGERQTRTRLPKNRVDLYKSIVFTKQPRLAGLFYCINSIFSSPLQTLHRSRCLHSKHHTLSPANRAGLSYFCA